jgi:hypothetical protein
MKRRLAIKNKHQPITIAPIASDVIREVQELQANERFIDRRRIRRVIVST